MKPFDEEEKSAQPATSEQPDWLNTMNNEPVSATPAQPAEEFDFLDEVREPPTAAETPAVTASLDTSALTTQTEDDAFAWLEENAASDDVVLSSVTTGQYIPALTGTHAFLAQHQQPALYTDCVIHYQQ